eukprot:1730815-Rhodomonas_salina.7
MAAAQSMDKNKQAKSLRACYAKPSTDSDASYARAMPCPVLTLVAPYQLPLLMTVPGNHDYWINGKVNSAISYAPAMLCPVLGTDEVMLLPWFAAASPSPLGTSPPYRPTRSLGHVRY